MKKLFLVLLTGAALASSASAQIYRPSVVGQTTVLGAVAGALIGGHNHDRWAQGAVIGAAAGAIVGSVIDDQRSRPVYAPSGYAVQTVPDAPMIGASGTTYVTPAPQVVYVPAPRRVVYVDPYPVYVSRPYVYVSTGWGHRGWHGHGHRYSHGHGHHRGHR